MRIIIPILLFFACLTAACTMPSVPSSPVATTSQADSSSVFSVPVYSNASIRIIPYNQLSTNGYADIPDRISPELAPVIANSSFSGNSSTVAHIALQDPCMQKLLREGGFILSVDYYIPFHGEPAPRLIIYVPGKTAERRISAFVNESEARISSLMVEYRFEPIRDKPDFDPFATEGWAGGYTCMRNQCTDVC